MHKTRRRLMQAVLAIALVCGATAGAGASAGAPSDAVAVVPPPSATRMLVGGTESMRGREGALGRPLDVVRTYTTWSPTSLPVLDMAHLRSLSDGGKRSVFLSAVIPWTAWKAAADVKSERPTAISPTTPASPNCVWRPTDPRTGAVLDKSWFAAFADGDYDARLRAWLTQVESLGSGVSPVFVSLMPEADRLDATAATARYRACVGTPEEYRAGWARAYEVATGAVGGGRNLNLNAGAGELVWVPVFTDWSLGYTAGIDAPERSLLVFKTGLPPPGAPPEEARLENARATPWMPPMGTWDHVGDDVFNFSGAVAGGGVPTRVKVDDPSTPNHETDQWRSLAVLTNPVLLWSQYNAPRPDGKLATVMLAEVGSVPDPTQPDRRPGWIRDGCVTLQHRDRIVAASYFDANTVRLSNWKWTKQADGSWDASSPPTGVDSTSIGRWGELMTSERAGGPGTCTGSPNDRVDEVHYSYGNSADEIVVDWRGAPLDLYLGLTPAYDRMVTATGPAIAPVDDPGPFREVRVNGLTPGTLYHYRIGPNGIDRTLRTTPTADFTWVDVGDTASTICRPYVAGTHKQIAAEAPNFVTHGGDISEANACSEAAVHQYYNDQQVWSTNSADMPVWGNHEYGLPIPPAEPGTPRDSLANYKGRHAIPHPQTVPNDTATQTSHPGCKPPKGGHGNGCRGEDWGWFDASGVRFISYPEPWPNALADWRTKAEAIMDDAQNNPSIDFIVTYGHRPAYSSQPDNGANPDVTAAVNALAQEFSPTARADGKYILSLGHHVHGLEQFAPQYGVTHIGNGGGGQGQTTWGGGQTAPGSLWKVRHMGHVRGTYDATAHALTVEIVCGPVFTPNPQDPCVYGSTLRTITFTAAETPPGDVQWVDNTGVEESADGWAGAYGANPVVSRTEGGHDSEWSMTVQATAASPTGAGLNDNPR